MDIRSLTCEELTEYLVNSGEARFRGEQVFKWLHDKKADSYDEMNNVSKKIKNFLMENYELNNMKMVKCFESKYDGTKKFLFRLFDGNVIESVFMKYKHGNSVCISSQVGCRMGCRFCASTIDGLERNLSASEMLLQIYNIEKLTQERVSNVVIMGSGEPLDNFDNLIRFIKIISDERGNNLSQRNITVSTCGLIPKMYELAEYDFQITLALSLHASSQEKRKKLMPVANKYEIHDVIKACSDYFDKTGRRISFEYSLVQGENDSKEDALELAELIRGLNAHVNLIPVNPVKERSYKRSDVKDIDNFKNNLERNGINVTIRREMGKDIDGACGQLRRSFLKEEEN